MPITRFCRPAASALLTAVLTLCLAPQALAQTGATGARLDPLLQHRARQISGRSRVIVQFKGETDVRVFGARGRAGRRLGGGMQVAELDNFALEGLAADPRVERVMLDRPAFATLERSGTATGATLAREELGLSGRGVGVAIIDSGITNWHDDLYLARYGRSKRVAHFKDFTQEATAVRTSAEAYDDFGHGTHVAGIVSGTGYDSGGRRRGIAPSAHLVGLKVLDRDGHGHVSDVIAALDYAVSISEAYGIRVINLSVGSGVYESFWVDPLALAARRAVEAGIVVVAAAGNLGLNDQGQVQFGGITSPGNAPWVLTVGATSHQGTAPRSDDAVGGFSSRGPTWIDFAAKPDLVAPGVGIESLSDPSSTLYHQLPDYLLSGTVDLPYQPYLSLTGTSMATPVVSGTVALMLEASPSLTPNAVKAILQYTAQELPDVTPLVQGAGMLNTLGAVRMARFFSEPRGGIGPMLDTIDGEAVAWARHIAWGNYEISGGLPLPGSNAWGTDVTWGAIRTALGEPVVWGARIPDNVVWNTGRGRDDNIVWSTGLGDNIVWSTGLGDNIVWSTDCGGANCQRVVWGSESDGVVWGSGLGDENIVWSTGLGDNIVWSTAGEFGDSVIWSTGLDDNIVWSTGLGDNIVWSTGTVQPVLWASAGDRQ